MTGRRVNNENGAADPLCTSGQPQAFRRRPDFYFGLIATGPRGADLPIFVQPAYEKYFASRRGRNTFIESRVPPRLKGRLADRHERWVRDAMDVTAQRTNVRSRTAKSCGPDA